MLVMLVPQNHSVYCGSDINIITIIYIKWV